MTRGEEVLAKVARDRDRWNRRWQLLVGVTLVVLIVLAGFAALQSRSNGALIRRLDVSDQAASDRQQAADANAQQTARDAVEQVRRELLARQRVSDARQADLLNEALALIVERIDNPGGPVPTLRPRAEPTPTPGPTATPDGG